MASTGLDIEDFDSGDNSYNSDNFSSMKMTRDSGYQSLGPLEFNQSSGLRGIENPLFPNMSSDSYLSMSDFVLQKPAAHTTLPFTQRHENIGVRDCRSESGLQNRLHSGIEPINQHRPGVTQPLGDLLFVAPELTSNTLGAHSGIASTTNDGQRREVPSECISSDEIAVEAPSSNIETERPAAVSFVKSWIALHPGVFPDKVQIDSLANLTSCKIQVIQRIFGNILQDNNTTRCEQEKSTHDGKDCVRTYGKEGRCSAKNNSLDPKLRREAAELLSQQPANCPSHRGTNRPMSKDRIYQCNACKATFAIKAVWKSHEERRFPQRGWVCDLDATQANGTLQCEPCGTRLPRIDHGGRAPQRQIACHYQALGRGTVFHDRGDFLNHLNRIHGIRPSTPCAATYLRRNQFEVKTKFEKECYICHDYTFISWQDRIDHLAQHAKGNAFSNKMPNGCSLPQSNKRGRHEDDDDDDESYRNNKDNYRDSHGASDWQPGVDCPPPRPAKHSSNSTSSGDRSQGSNTSCGSHKAADGYSNDAIREQDHESIIMSSEIQEKWKSRLRALLLEARVLKNDNGLFIPADELQNLLSERNISLELSGRCFMEISPRDCHRVIGKIANKFKKIFAILVLIQKPEGILHFLEEDLNDGDLPIPSRRPDFYTSEATSRCIPKVFESWERWELDEFCRIQWWFLAPFFAQGLPHYNFHPNTILPFIEEDPNSRDGGFSTVWRATIHPAHHSLVPNTKAGRAPEFAVKRLHSRNQQDFLAEAEMLKRFSGSRQHQHIIKVLATYQFRGQYHLVFPWAKANLRDHWYNLKEPWLRPQSIEWALKQCLGLVKGLAQIHGYYEELYGRHGDLKPENILCFDSSNHKLGVLVIADLGLTRFHRNKSRSNIDPQHVGGSPTYEPPEIAISKPISRAYDIWSLGCILLEFTTWLLMGSKGLQEFTKARTYAGEGKQVISDTFYELTPLEKGLEARACVKPSVNQWIERLRAHDRGRDKLIQDMLSLIKDRLLIADPNQRINTGEIVLFFIRLLRKEPVQGVAKLPDDSLNRKKRSS